MSPQASVIWNTLELRMPAMMQCLDRLSESQLRWQPPRGADPPDEDGLLAYFRQARGRRGAPLRRSLFHFRIGSRRAAT